VKTHYGGQRLLSQILLFEIACFKISTESILKQSFTKNSWNKVVQNPKNKIIKKKSHFEIDIKWLKSILMKKL
jgi:hypothetical protein